MPKFKSVRPAYMSANPTHHRVVSPKATHTRPATCWEVNCQKLREGWTTTIPNTSDLCGVIRFGLYQAGGGRQFTERITETEIEFTFQPGQICFEAHRKSLERTPFFFKGTSGRLIHQEPIEWLDNLGNKLVRGTW
jgi:hypothetical protein